MTTGRRWISKLNIPRDEQDSIRRQVREENRQATALALKKCKANRPGIWLNPCAFEDPDGWGQSDFHCFWAEVLRRWVDRVVMMTDWPYSRGCCYEFVIAQECELPCASIDGSPLSIEDGIVQIEAACRDLAKNGLEIEFHQACEEKLQKLLADE